MPARVSLFLSAALLCGLPGGQAAAHVTANPSEGPADGYFRTSFRISHGCGGTATTLVRVKMPEGLTSVRPQVKPGWEIAITMRKLDQPVDGGHGIMITETVDEVTWRGGSLPDAYFDEFGLSMKLPAGPGRTLYFPTVQECEKGENRWVEIPAAGQRWGSLKAPAPFVRTNEAPAAAVQPAITVLQAWARASAGTTRPGAAYLTIANTKAEADRLLSFATPAAAKAELHATVKDGEIMRMRPVPAITIEPGSRVELQPGGLHLMLVDLAKPLKEGDRFPLTLTFEKAGKITTEVLVRAPGATSGGAADHHHGHGAGQ